ncbi:MAG: glutamate racemase [Chloroherpetonaceae bacterium]|nr:glutamate racemase [Chloroherpetonaceae bacterium]
METTNSSTQNHSKRALAEAPIGVFDSGVGGLTVVRRIVERLPTEHIVYFGDTARVPYGTKSVPTIRKYAAENTALLLRESPKLIVVACNTVSALALDVVQAVAADIPVLGVVTAGARLALERSTHRRIGVIGTEATIASQAYHRELSRLCQHATIVSKACPLFVPLAEEGFTTHRATHLIAEEYLSELRNAGIDTLILGCTHYPLLRSVIADVMGEDVFIVDSAEAVAIEVETLLTRSGLLNLSNTMRRTKFMVSDLPQKFHQLAERFLGFALSQPELILWD